MGEGGSAKYRWIDRERVRERERERQGEDPEKKKCLNHVSLSYKPLLKQSFFQVRRWWVSYDKKQRGCKSSGVMVGHYKPRVAQNESEPTLLTQRSFQVRMYSSP